MADLRSLFAPASVAIVGATPGNGRGGVMQQHLVRLAYSGDIYPVNPRYEEVRGVRCYPSLTAVPGPAECVALAVGAERAVQALEDAARIGASGAVVVASGFGEAGDDGVELQQRLTSLVAEGNMVLCGPNCYGVADFHTGFAAYGGPLPDGLRPGNVALLMQSGALTHSILNPGCLRGLGLSLLVTAGNEGVTSIADYLDHAAADENTTVIACFLETVRAPRAFLAAARRARSAGKDIVVLKTGRSSRARTAAVAHTGALSGDNRRFDALCDKLGIVRVDDLDELIECCLLLSRERRLGEGPVTLVSISGGGSGVMADLAMDRGVSFTSFDTQTEKRLWEVLPHYATVHNPLDLTGAVGEQPALVNESVSALAQAPGGGAVGLALNASTADTEEETGLYMGMMTAAADAAQVHGTPFFAFSMTSGPFAPTLVAAAEEYGVPLLQGMRETIAVLGRLRRARSREAALTEPETTPLGIERHRGRLCDGGALTEREAKDLLETMGVSSPRERLVNSGGDAVTAAADIGVPVVLKVVSPDVPHKVDAGGVVTGVATPDAAADAYSRITTNVAARCPDARIHGVSVAEMVTDGVDVLVGGLGGAQPVVVLGVGGVLTELFEPAVRLAPVDEHEASSMIEEVSGHELLDGVRGAAPADKAALAHTLVRVSRLVWLLRDDLAELDVNPLRVLPEGGGVVALDALAVPTTPG